MQPTEARTIAGRCGWFTAFAAGLWLLLVGPAYSVAGFDGLCGVSIAAGLCLIPGLVVLCLAARMSQSGSPAGAILSGNVLRMLFVLAGTLTVQSELPHLRFREFIVWLLVFYLAMLVVETLFILRLSQPAVEGARAQADATEGAAG